MFYNYPSHYLYDFVVLTMNILLAKQVFNLTLTRNQIIAFVGWMMIFYQINFYLIVPNYPREYKYIILYLGLILAYYLIANLSFTASLIVIMTTTALNGIWTNINLGFMLQFVFKNYGLALESQHLQYTCYTLTIVIMASLVMLFRFRIFDIQKYN